MRTIRKGKTGWIMEKDAYVKSYNMVEQGARTGLIVLLPYTEKPYGYDQSTDLEAQHNDTYTVAEILAEMIFEWWKDWQRNSCGLKVSGWNDHNLKTIRRGHIVC